MSFVPGYTNPVSDYPFGSIDPSLLKGVFDPFAIPVLPTVAQKVYLLYSYPVDDDGVEVEIKTATSDYGSQPGDTPADFEFDGKLLESYSLSNSIIGSSGAFSGSVAAPALSKFVVLNPYNPEEPNENLDSWLDLHWENRRWELYFGDYNEPLGTIIGRGPVNVGRYGSEPVGKEDRIVLQPRDMRTLLSVPLQPNRYLGIGNCLEFASGAKVDVTGAWGRTITDEFSMECLVCPTSLPTAGNYGWLITYGPGTTRARLGFKGDALVFERSVGSYELVAPAGSISADVWQSVQVRYHSGGLDGGSEKLELRVDGEVVATDDSPTMSNLNLTSDIQLGDASESYVGKMDEVRIWAHARTDNEMASSARTKVSPSADGLVWYSRGVTDDPVTPTKVIDERTTPDRDYADTDGGDIDFGNQTHFDLTNGGKSFEINGCIVPDNTVGTILSTSQFEIEVRDSPTPAARVNIINDTGTDSSPWISFLISSGPYPLHFAVTWNNTTKTAELIIGGIHEASTSVSATDDVVSASDGLVVEQIQVGEVRAWNAQKSKADIIAARNSSLTGTETNLQLLARMAGDSTDATSNGYDGTDTSVTYSDTNGAITGTVDEVPSLEGTEDMEGLPKPLGFGSVQWRRPVLLDAALLIYQIHDGSIEGNVELTEGGDELTNAGTSTDLPSETIASGSFMVDLTRGLIRLGSVNDVDGPLRVKFDGDNARGSGVFSSLRGEITRRCAEHAEALTWPDDFDFDSFADTDAAYPFDVALYTGTEDWSLIKAVEWLSQPFGLLIGRPSGVLSMGVAEPPEDKTAESTWTPEIIEEGSIEATPLPVFSQVIIGYAEIDPLGDSDVVGSVYTDDPAFASRLQRKFLPASSGPRKSPIFKEAVPVEIESPLVNEADAKQMAEHGRKLRGVRRKVVKMVVNIGPHVTDINTVRELDEIGRYGLDGKQGLVGDRRESGGSKKVEVRLWV